MSNLPEFTELLSEGDGIFIQDCLTPVSACNISQKKSSIYLLSPRPKLLSPEIFDISLVWLIISYPPPFFPPSETNSFITVDVGEERGVLVLCSGEKRICRKGASN